MKFRSLFTGFLCLFFCILLNYETGTVNAGFEANPGDFEGNYKDSDGTFYDFEDSYYIGWRNIPYFEFVPSLGDYFVVDIKNGLGYLMNDNTQFYSIVPVITGGRGTPTPAREWVVKQKDIKSNRIFYSASGEFFRMFADGTKRTGYGIHGYAYFQKEVEKGTKFLSWGCIWVSDDMLDVLEQSYIMNGNSLKVSTRESVDLLTLI